MVFSSAIFLFVFLPLVLGIYFLTPRFLKNLFLLFASLVFYAWGEGFFVFVMLASIAINYIAGLAIDKTRENKSGLWVLAAAVGLNLIILLVFKYANFVVDNLNVVLTNAGLPPFQLDPVHLPIGISFFTFQAISYVVDIYRGDAQVQKNPINASLYISLFPQLIAGPIVRYQSIAKELVQRQVTLDNFYTGACLFIIGLGKKMLIANPMGEVADGIFAIDNSQLTFALSWLGVIAYTLQIYFDFSGYSDMALGLGRMLGFTFPINFNYPYIARSMREFWRRWHISLSSWFRDYLYIPLGGNRGSQRRVFFNLTIVFVLCGLWHGASWNFLIWGLCHGLFLGLERTRWGAFIERLWSPLRWSYVILVVMLTWVIFRSETMAQAGGFLLAMLGTGQGDGIEQYVGLYMSKEKWLVMALGVIGATPWIKRAWAWAESALPGAEVALHSARFAALGLIMLGCYMHLAAGTHNPFIYFRF